MKKSIFYGLLLVIFFQINCSSPKYIFDDASYQRQIELKKHRKSEVAGEIVAASLSAVISAAAGTEIEYYPNEIQFRKLKLENPTNDTLFVNMVTNVSWDSLGYCDFMDIRIPPGKNCRLLCPIDAEYNVYFRNKWDTEQDEMITINTSETINVHLKPGKRQTSQTE